jgi:exosortase family protein XrtF
MRLSSKFTSFLQKNSLLFIFLSRLGAVYLLWLFIYDLQLINTKPLDQFLIQNLIDTCVITMQQFGFEMFESGSRYVGIQDSSGVEIGPPCNAFSLFVLYTSIIVAFPGKWRLKLLFVVCGVFIIHLLNVIRVILLVYLAKFNPAVLAFNHSYTFTLVVYGCIFVMWMVWIKHYAKAKTKKVENIT